jgi:tetratricopeptide (TPR) repeat protein
MLSFLSFDDIFLELFGLHRPIESAGTRTDEASTSWRCVISPEQRVDMYKIEECFAVLQKYSLVQWKTDQQSYAMHKLVHAWGYDRLAERDQCKFSRAAFGLVVEAVKSCGRASEDKLRLVPHVMASFAALNGAIGRSNRVTRILINELESVGVFITDLGRWLEGGVIQQVVLDERSRLLGEEHPDTISAMSNLAITLGDQGQLDQAARMRKEVLEKRRRILGEEHPSTISAMSNVAVTLGAQGQLDEAVRMKKEVLEKMRWILGEEHPDTILAMGNLASTLRDQGQLNEAARMKKKAYQQFFISFLLVLFVSFFFVFYFYYFFSFSFFFYFFFYFFFA